MRRPGTAEIDFVLRHRRRLEPDQGFILGLHELFDQIMQHLPLGPLYLDLFPAMTF